MLADRLVELEFVDTISIKTVERTLKNALQLRTKKQWVIPLKENANVVATMEDVLEVYRRPFDPVQPVVCMDEQPIQLHDEVREPIPAQPGRPEKHDYEYKRNSVVCGFMFTESLGQWRRITISETRTKKDWAHQVQHLLEVDYPDAEKVILVCDNLNTYVPGAFYETFPPERAQTLMSRLEIHYTPKHGSWLSIAEIELSALTRQCLKRRIPTIEALRAETTAWNRQSNQSQKGVDWQFTAEDARVKLKWLYPMILEI